SLRGADAAVLEQRLREVPEDQPLVSRATAETGTLGGGRHACSSSSARLSSVVVVVVVAVVVGTDDQRGVEVSRAVLERQAEADQLLLDLGDRLRTEVADVEEVGLAACDELAHGVDALALEAVVGAD